jgi:hypothetical protein
MEIRIMTPSPIAAALVASLFVTGAALAQTTPQIAKPTHTAQKQRPDGDSPTSIGAGAAPTSSGPKGSAKASRTVHPAPPRDPAATRLAQQRDSLARLPIQRRLSRREAMSRTPCTPDEANATTAMGQTLHARYRAP